MASDRTAHSWYTLPAEGRRGCGDEVARPVGQADDLGRGLPVGRGELDLLACGSFRAAKAALVTSPFSMASASRSSRSRRPLSLRPSATPRNRVRAAATAMVAAATRSGIDRGGGLGRCAARPARRPAALAGGGPGRGRARGRRLVEGFGDPVPHAFGGPLAAVGEEGGGLPVALDLGPAAGAAGQVGLDDVALVVVDGVEGEGPEELLDVVVGEAGS